MTLLPFQHYHNWIDDDLASHLFHCLSESIAWQQEQLILYGKAVKVPREVAFYGDTGVNYVYSKKTHSALPWLPDLLQIYPSRIILRHSRCENYH